VHPSVRFHASAHGHEHPKRVVLLDRVMTVPRGVRNENPGNIRLGRSDWRGSIARSTDPDFVQFEHAIYGIRALANLLRNYRAKYGLETVNGIISRYAPPNENETMAYVNRVAEYLGVEPDAKLDLDNREMLRRLIEAIIWHENGQQPYAQYVIEDGIILAVTA
jgi:hypothetical protein